MLRGTLPLHFREYYNFQKVTILQSSDCDSSLWYVWNITSLCVAILNEYFYFFSNSHTNSIFILATTERWREADFEWMCSFDHMYVPAIFHSKNSCHGFTYSSHRYVNINYFRFNSSCFPHFHCFFSVMHRAVVGKRWFVLALFIQWCIWICIHYIII